MSSVVTRAQYYRLWNFYDNIDVLVVAVPPLMSSNVPQDLASLAVRAGSAPNHVRPVRSASSESLATTACLDRRSSRMGAFQVIPL